MATEDVRSLLQPNKIRMIVIGKTGSGKSSTANSILGKEQFTSSLGFESTTGCSAFAKTARNGREIQVTDSPGTFDTEHSKEEVEEEIARGVALITPGPHAILIVIRIGHFTDEEYQSYIHLKNLFGPEMVRYTFLIFTGMDQLQKAKQSLDSLLQRNTNVNLKVLLTDANGRYMGFDNTAIMEMRIQQADHLIDLVVQNVERNNGQFFTCNVIDRFEQAMKKEAEKRIQAKLEAEEKRKQEDYEKKERERMQEALAKMELKLQESEKRQREAEDSNKADQQKLVEEMQKEIEKRLREVEEINRAEKQKLIEEMKNFRSEIYEKERSEMQKEIADRNNKYGTIGDIIHQIGEFAAGCLPDLFRMIVKMNLAPKQAITSGK